jgi:hypothetical protein
MSALGLPVHDPGLVGVRLALFLEPHNLASTLLLRLAVRLSLLLKQLASLIRVAVKQQPNPSSKRSSRRPTFETFHRIVDS